MHSFFKKVNANSDKKSNSQPISTPPLSKQQQEQIRTNRMTKQLIKSDKHLISFQLPKILMALNNWKVAHQ